MPSYGRGGAGNIQAIEQATARISADLEAKHSAADSYTKEPLSSDYAAREAQMYKHTGRGGAGNYFSPKDLRQTGNFDHVPPPGVGSKTSALGIAMEQTIRTLGRGGAGNYAFGMSENADWVARKGMEDEAKREKLTQDIEKGVEKTLALPQKAKLPGSESY